MESMAQVFKATRERKRISLSQAAAQTRIKVQHLECMERGDFSRMPAPAYAKGFIRLYADYLGLDPVPLIQEYTDEYMGGGKRAAKPAAPAPVAPPAPVPAPVAPPKPAPPPVTVSPPAAAPAPPPPAPPPPAPPPAAIETPLELLFTPEPTLAEPDPDPAPLPELTPQSATPVAPVRAPEPAAKKSPPKPAPEPVEPVAPAVEPVPAVAPPPSEPRVDWTQRLARLQRTMSHVPWQKGIGIAVLVAVLYVIIISLSRCAKESTREPPSERPLVLKKGVPAVIAEPEPPYLAPVDAVQENP